MVPGSRMILKRKDKVWEVSTSALYTKALWFALGVQVVRCSTPNYPTLFCGNLAMKNSRTAVIF